MESSTEESINEIATDKTKSSKNVKSVSLKHTDSVGILPSLNKEKGKVSAKKKLSHPVSFLSLNNPKIKIDPISCRDFSTSQSIVSPKDDQRRELQRKDTKDTIKCFTYGEDEADEEGLVTCSVTQSLESAVRKLSRSSPNRSGGQDMPGIRAGLAILARGYEQYREGIHLLNPTEFGEASSDDLSSEWESSADQARRIRRREKLAKRKTKKVIHSLCLYLCLIGRRKLYPFCASFSLPLILFDTRRTTTAVTRVPCHLLPLYSPCPCPLRGLWPSRRGDSAPGGRSRASSSGLPSCRPSRRGTTPGCSSRATRVTSGRVRARAPCSRDTANKRKKYTKS